MVEMMTVLSESGSGNINNQNTNNVACTPFGSDALNKDCLVVVLVWCPTGLTVTGITAGAGGANGTYAKIAGYDPGVGRKAMELWIGYNLPNALSNSSTLTAFLSGTTSGSATKGIFCQYFRFSAPQVSAPSIIGTTVGAHGTGTVIDPGGTVLPSPGDFVIQGFHNWANSYPVTPYGDTPSGQPLAHYGTVDRSFTPTDYCHGMYFRQATTNSAHKKTVTIASSDWVTVMGVIRPIYSNSTDTIQVYKGRDVNAGDTVGAV